MDHNEYAAMLRVEDRHWWYVGMRRIGQALLDQHIGGRPARVLDAGCGTGANLVFLERWGLATGVDIEPLALAGCRQRDLVRLAAASVDNLPFSPESFDLVTSFDVYYHAAVRDDAVALREAWRVLRPGGWLYLRLPAYNWLRGRHDVAVHTRRRYSRREVQRKVQAAGFHIVRLSYANCLLLPLAIAKRVAERWQPGHDGSDIGEPPTGNGLLTSVLAAEARWLRRWDLPWGLSVLCLARKPGGPGA